MTPPTDTDLVLRIIMDTTAHRDDRVAALKRFTEISFNEGYSAAVEEMKDLVTGPKAHPIRVDEFSLEV